MKELIMEKKNDRVLAYSMAKVISVNEMSEVGGGSHASHHETLKPSGARGSWDACIDISIDF